MGLPSAVDAVMFLLSLLLLDSLHAVVGFTVSASIPAFGGVHTVLAVLMLLSFLLLLAFLLLWAVMKLLSFLMLLVAGVLLLLVSLLLLASRQWQTFLLLLASFKFLKVSCYWSLCYCWCSWCKPMVLLAFLLLLSNMLSLTVLQLQAFLLLRVFLLLLVSLLTLVSIF
jgi:hypothetical protein